MLLNKILKVVLLLLGGTYILLQGFALEVEGDTVGAIGFILLTVLYVGWTKNKSKLFLMFLVAFTTAQILSFIGWHRPGLRDGQTDYLYYIANILSIISYALLILKVFIHLNLKTVFSQLTVPIIILVILDIFCVTLISSTTENSFNLYEYILEYVYNVVIMLLLSIALINYMYRNNYKSMLFLIGSIFIMFSEIIQLAYFYILKDDNLGYVYSSFLVVAFIFYYLQSQHLVTEPTPAYSDDPIEA
ncbi:hypothetical protein [Winogradskyella pacifica]|uniref:hypothetical protein n=1 Tax=Winogradskyella pacifica TaxID=664642 RepID=UPI0015CB0D5C|nr:hypothetical protein [Winogradskyella pacifica]